MNITRRSFGLAALGGMLLPALPAIAKAPFAGAQAAGVYRLKVGGFEVTVLNDGSLPIETKFFTGNPEGAAKLLEGRFLSKAAPPTAVPPSTNGSSTPATSSSWSTPAPRTCSARGSAGWPRTSPPPASIPRRSTW